MKEEALKLANELDALHQYVPSDAPAMIRRLVEELDYQNTIKDNLRQQLAEKLEELDKQTKPLSDEEIGDILFKYGEKDEWFNFARAIEERHGIK